MSVPTNVITLKQERTLRPAGYQLSQWISRYPEDATQPAALEPVFVVRSVENTEYFERVAVLLDTVSLSENPLTRFDFKGVGGDAALAALRPYDVIRATGEETRHWLQTEAPYNDRDFTVYQISARKSGSASTMLSGGRLQLDGYTFSDDDIGRWVYLQGFVDNTSYNGYAKVLRYEGNTAYIDKTTTATETSGGGWYFYWAEIVVSSGGSVEPRYFPDKRAGITWRCLRDGSPIVDCSGDAGETYRSNPSLKLFRSVRWTSIEATLQNALDFMASVVLGVRALQREADRNNGTDSAVVVTVVGG